MIARDTKFLSVYVDMIYQTYQFFVIKYINIIIIFVKIKNFLNNTLI